MFAQNSVFGKADYIELWEVYGRQNKESFDWHRALKMQQNLADRWLSQMS